MVRTHRTSLSSSPLARTLVAALSVAALCAGCRSHVTIPPGAENEGLVAGDLRAKNPLDIAIPAVQDLTERGDLPLEAMRRAFHSALVARQYSPLSLEYVDGKTVEASYTPGASAEQGILQVQVTGWNDDYWDTHTRLVIDADIWLLDPENPVPARAMWGGHVQRTVDMARERRVTIRDDALMEQTMRKFATAVLASLPARNPEIATAR